MRFHDPADLTQALDELPALPLAISSISAAGTRALATSLDGTAALIDVEEKKFIDRVETGRVPPKAGENGEYLRLSLPRSLCLQADSGKRRPRSSPGLRFS